MNTPDRSLRLQQVADHRTVRKTLRGSSIASVVFGAITLLSAIVPPLDPLLLILGLVLLGTGTWNLARPRPTGILLDGSSVLLVGLFNVVGSVLAAIGGGGAGSRMWLHLGVFQLIWAGQTFVRYGRFRDAFRDPPSDLETRQLDVMVENLWRAKPKESTDIIELKVKGFQETAWKARLTESMAVMATDGGREVMVARKDEIDIRENGKVMIGSALKATLTVRGKDMKGTIPPDSYERFQQWKTGVVIPKAIAA